MARIGLIAGKGELPAIWARAAGEKGNEVYAFPLVEEADNPLEGIAAKVSYVNIGALDSLIAQLSRYEIKKVVMIGKVEKTRFFQDLNLDGRMKRLLAGLKELNDDAIMLAIVRELAREGIEVIEQSTYLEDLFPEPGVLTSHEPDEELLADMRYGFKMAREIGRLDIGQTVVVKDRAVLAVEAIEGTDAAIQRGGLLGGPGVVVAKVSKPRQDWRFDIPTVGANTLSNLIAVKARGLVIEAGKTFLLARERIIEEADRNEIVIMAMDSNPPE